MKKTPHILILRFSAMGDVALSVPVIKSLRRAYPGIRISLLTRAFFHPFFDGLHQIELLPVDLKGKHKGFTGIYRLSKEILDNTTIDAVIDLHDVLRTKLLRIFFSLHGIPVFTIDKGRKEKKHFLTNPWNRKFLPHTIERYHKVFMKAGFEFSLSKEYFTPSSTVIPEALFPENKKYIGIAPFAAHRSKQWGLDNIEELIRLINNNNNQIYFYLFGGGKRESVLLEEISTHFDNVVNTAGKYDLRTELNILKFLDVFIGMDSGNAHLAALSGIPVITLWGGTHPGAGFAPLYQPADNILLPEKSLCNDCRFSVYGSDKPQRKTPPYYCIQHIKPKEVISLLSAKGYI